MTRSIECLKEILAPHNTMFSFYLFCLRQKGLFRPVQLNSVSNCCLRATFPGGFFLSATILFNRHTRTNHSMSHASALGYTSLGHRKSQIVETGVILSVQQ